MPSLPLFVVGKLTAAALNAVVNAVNPVGQSLVVPTSVTVGSGSRTISTLGTVTLTAVGSFILNGVFPSSGNYLLVLRGQTSVASSFVNAQLALAGSAVTTANYDSTYVLSAVSTTTSASSNASTSWVFGANGSAVKTVDAIFMSPGVADYSTGILRVGEGAAGGVSALTQVILSHRLQVAYDGLSITFGSSGLFTGTASMYKLNNG